MARHFYFHIPFCAKLCPYCSFYVETRFRHKNRRFLEALLREVDQLGEQFEFSPETVYFGGGTPSALSLAELEFLLGGLRERLRPGPEVEWTFEVNPATVSAEKARLLRQLGVNRISLGAQSWNEETLKTLGRIHTASQTERTLELLRTAGFDNINIDLMFAVPGQSLEQWRESLERTVAAGPEHVSAYCLTYEEDTEYFRKLDAGIYRQETDWDAELFELTMDLLPAAGFVQYEISNFAKPGRESRHNLACWEGREYLGIGPSAFSTHGEERWQNVPDVEAYTAGILDGKGAVSFRETVAKREAEIIAFALRTNRGVEAGRLEPWRAGIEEFHELGLLATVKDRVVLTRKGKLLADSVGELFV